MSDLDIHPYYETVVNNLDTPGWLQKYDFEQFSPQKKLYDYQTQAIQNAVILLSYWGEIAMSNGESAAKQALYSELQAVSDDSVDTHELRLKEKDLGASLFYKLRERYPVHTRTRYGYEYTEVDFKEIVNQMGFWMATGSGKTVIILKLIEVIYQLKRSGVIPDNKILLLVPSADILTQFQQEIQEFNKSGEYTIDYKPVENFASQTQQRTPPNTIPVYVKRADLITEETKEKQISFEEIENGGNWYLFLDEAHKGQSTASKRQAYYSMLSRNGFLFNASATFTDPSDIVTTVYNYNIERFISDGYGKNIFVADESLQSITDDQFPTATKTKTVLKSLIALTAQKQASMQVDEPYHNPLLTAFVNSVNTRDADLELFFEVVERIGSEYNEELFTTARDELHKELATGSDVYAFGDDTADWIDITSITKQDVLESVYNASEHSQLEVLHSTENRREIAFKLKTASSAFALMRIGRKTTWIQEKLDGRDIIEDSEFHSYFNTINNTSSPINLLLGSRTFYEGWDSNRPNVMLFINLGRSEKKKLVMQAIGRGMRIEPKANTRKRAAYTNINVQHPAATKTLETLLVFATSATTIETILSSFDIVTSQPTNQPQNIQQPPTSITEITRINGNRDILQSYWEKTPDSLLKLQTTASDSVFETLYTLIWDDEYTDLFDDTTTTESPVKQLRQLTNLIRQVQQNTTKNSR